AEEVAAGEALGLERDLVVHLGEITLAVGDPGHQFPLFHEDVAVLDVDLALAAEVGLLPAGQGLAVEQFLPVVRVPGHGRKRQRQRHQGADKHVSRLSGHGRALLPAPCQLTGKAASMLAFNSHRFSSWSCTGWTSGRPEASDVRIACSTQLLSGPSGSNSSSS